MAIVPQSTPNESADDVFASNPQMAVTQQKTWEFAQVGEAAEYAVGTPVGFDTDDLAGKWVAPDPTVLVIDLDGATAGSFTVTINGMVATIAYDDTAAEAAANILGLGHEVSVTLADDVYTFTFDSDMDVATLPTVVASVTGITTAGTATVTLTDGTATNGLHKIVGFVWPEPVNVLTTGSVLAVCAVYCKIDYDLIASNVDSDDYTALQEALRSEALSRGISVENLGQVH